MEPSARTTRTNIYFIASGAVARERRKRRDGRSPLGRQRRETLPAERVEREKDGANARKQWLKKDGQKRNRPKKRSGTKMGTRIDSGRKRREIDRRTKEREEERERKREGNARVARGLAKETKVSRSLAVDG